MEVYWSMCHVTVSGGAKSPRRGHQHTRLHQRHGGGGERPQRRKGGQTQDRRSHDGGDRGMRGGPERPAQETWAGGGQAHQTVTTGGNSLIGESGGRRLYCGDSERFKKEKVNSVGNIEKCMT